MRLRSSWSLLGHKPCKLWNQKRYVFCLENSDRWLELSRCLHILSFGVKCSVTWLHEMKAVWCLTQLVSRLLRASDDHLCLFILHSNFRGFHLKCGTNFSFPSFSQLTFVIIVAFLWISFVLLGLLNDSALFSFSFSMTFLFVPQASSWHFFIIGFYASSSLVPHSWRTKSAPIRDTSWENFHDLCRSRRSTSWDCSIIWCCCGPYQASPFPTSSAIAYSVECSALAWPFFREAVPHLAFLRSWLLWSQAFALCVV